MTTNQQTLFSLKPGDKIAIQNRNSHWSRHERPKVKYQIFEVVILTKTQAVAVLISNRETTTRFRLDDGYVIGGNHWNRAIVATPEMVAEHNEQCKASAEFDKALSRFFTCEDAMRKSSLTTKQMNEISDVWERITKTS